MAFAKDTEKTTKNIVFLSRLVICSCLDIITAFVISRITLLNQKYCTVLISHYKNNPNDLSCKLMKNYLHIYPIINY
jgi:hypothetical protein